MSCGYPQAINSKCLFVLQVIWIPSKVKVEPSSHPGNTMNGPMWHIEKARVGKSRNIPIELIVNGEPVARKEIEANGNFHDLRFDYAIQESSWVAIRVLPSSHTNPIFV